MYDVPFCLAVKKLESCFKLTFFLWLFPCIYIIKLVRVWLRISTIWAVRLQICFVLTWPSLFIKCLISLAFCLPLSPLSFSFPLLIYLWGDIKLKLCFYFSSDSINHSLDLFISLYSSLIYLLSLYHCFLLSAPPPLSTSVAFQLSCTWHKFGSAFEMGSSDNTKSATKSLVYTRLPGGGAGKAWGERSRQQEGKRQGYPIRTGHSCACRL